VTDLATAYRGVRMRVRALVVDHGAEAGNLAGAGTDLRGALGCPGARDSDAMLMGFHWVVARVGTSRNAAGIGALAVAHEAGTTVCGDGPTAAAVRVTRFEFTGAATGRRSPDQVAAYEWAIERGGLARPDLLVVTPFTPRLAALVE
jgi:hypothetical protein